MFLSMTMVLILQRNHVSIGAIRHSIGDSDKGNAILAFANVGERRTNPFPHMKNDDASLNVCNDMILSRQIPANYCSLK